MGLFFSPALFLLLAVYNADVMAGAGAPILDHELNLGIEVTYGRAADRRSLDPRPDCLPLPGN